MVLVNEGVPHPITIEFITSLAELQITGSLKKKALLEFELYVLAIVSVDQFFQSSYTLQAKIVKGELLGLAKWSH